MIKEMIQSALVILVPISIIIALIIFVFPPLSYYSEKWEQWWDGYDEPKISAMAETETEFNYLNRKDSAEKDCEERLFKLWSIPEPWYYILASSTSGTDRENAYKEYDCWYLDVKKL